MSDLSLLRFARVMAFAALSILVVSTVLLFMSPERSNMNWLENQVKAIVTLGAPVIGLIIIKRQPRNRIAWLWVIYGLMVGVRTLGHAIYYFNGSQPTGYTALEYFLLWSTELATIAQFICLTLLMLWFPDGQLVSRKWRFLYIWLSLAATVMVLLMFTAGPDWNGGVEAGGIVIENPYGWLTVDAPFFVGFSAFISIILIMILALLSLVFRYRKAGLLERLQLRWFVLGGLLLVCFQFFPIFFSWVTQNEAGYLLYVLSFSAILPLYLAVGIAILRYRLFDIDIIIRRTLQYTLFTALLLLVYFSSVLLLQNLVENFTGQGSPIVIVVSTLVIAALFNPLRIRVQDFIDRRFYRSKFNAEKTLAQFAITARDEVDVERLVKALMSVVDATLQPAHISLRIKSMVDLHYSDQVSKSETTTPTEGNLR